MALVIDPLSVATQGLLETPSTPSVTPPRDALRIATLGWILLFTGPLPDPDQDTAVIIFNALTDALISEPAGSTFITAEYRTAALVDDASTDAAVNPADTLAEVDDAATDARLQPSQRAASLEDGSASATIGAAKTAADVDNPAPDANIQSGKTTANVEPEDE